MQNRSFEAMSHRRQCTECRLWLATALIAAAWLTGCSGKADETHPAARAALALLGVKSANELGEIAVAVGLAQNIAALRALATEGIQRGHMALHARNIAILAGAAGDQIERVAAELAANHDVSVDHAKSVLTRLKSQS